MRVYIDILFFTNFLVDFLLIKASGKIMSWELKKIRCFLSALAGAIIGVLFFYLDKEGISTFLASVFVGLIMIFIAFSPRSAKEILKAFFALYACSAVFAGVAFFLIIQFGGGIVKNGIFYAKTPAIILSAALVYAAVSLGFGALKRRILQKRHEVVLEYNKKKVKLFGMVDTGNGLFEPKSKKPVMLIEPDVLKKLIDKNCNRENLYEWIDTKRIKIIPYKSIDKEGILTGIVLDRAIIQGRAIDGAIAAVSIESLKYPVILNAGM